MGREEEEEEVEVGVGIGRGRGDGWRMGVEDWVRGGERGRVEWVGRGLGRRSVGGGDEDGRKRTSSSSREDVDCSATVTADSLLDNEVVVDSKRKGTGVVEVDV